MDTRKMMKIHQLPDYGNEIEIITTGAKYVFDKSSEYGTIDCYQMLNCERLLATIKFNYSFQNLIVDSCDEQKCMILVQPLDCEANAILIHINIDSSIQIDSGFSMEYMINGHFRPEYNCIKNGHTILLDDIGGIGIYPENNLIDFEISDSSSSQWKCTMGMKIYSRLYVSVFPPREFSLDQYYNDNIYHRWYRASTMEEMIYPIPADDELEEASQYANIVVIHACLYKGTRTRVGEQVITEKDAYADASYTLSAFEPIDENKLRHAIDKAHALSMKVLLYSSPFYNMLRSDDFLRKIESLIQTYQLDGIYFDGLPLNISEAYGIVKKTRDILGEKLFYLHDTFSTVASTKIHTPFIETYVDYTLRAEHIREFSDRYLKYVISGYNKSNAIGHVCFWGYPTEFVNILIDKCIDLKVKFFLDTIGSITENEKVIKEKYFPKLNQQKRSDMRTVSSGLRDLIDEGEK